MAVLSTLEVQLRLAAESFSNDIRAAQREAKEFEKDMKPLKDAIFDIGSTMTAAGGLVLGAMSAMALKTADFGDALNDARQRTGVSAEDLSKLAYAAELSGTSMDGVSSAVKFLSKNMESAINKSGEQRSAFASLGISAKDLEEAHGDVNTVLLKIADRFTTLPDGAEKSAAAMQIFGKSGTDLIPLLNSGSEGIAAMGDEAERLGIVMSDEAAAAADEFNDKLAGLKGAAEGIGISIGSALIPPLTSFFEVATNVVVAVKDWVAAHPDLTRAVGALAAVITGAGGLLLGVTGIVAILPSLTVAFTVLTGPVGIAVLAVGALVTAFTAFPSFRAVVIDVLKAVTESLGFLGSYLKSIGEAVFELATGRPGEAMKTMGSSYSRALDTATEAADFFDDSLKAVSGSTKDTQAKVIDLTDKAFVPLHRQTKDNTDALKKQNDEWKELQSNLSKIPIGGYASDWERLEGKINGTKTKVELLRAALISIPPEAEQASIGVENVDFAAAAAATGIDSLNKNVAALIAQPPAVAVSFGPTEEDIEEDKQRLADATESVRQSAGKIFDDMFLQGENVFTSLGNLLKGGALSLGRSIFEDVTAELLGPIKLAFDDFFTGLLESTGIKTFISGIGNKIGGAISGIFGGGSEVVSSAAGGASSAAGGIGSIGSAAGGATSLTGSFIAAGGAVLGGIISALGSARQEGTLNAIEANTRATYLDIEHMMNGHLSWIINYQTIMAQQLGYDGVNGWLRDMDSKLERISNNTASLAGLPHYAMGTNYVPVTGPAILHQGEQVIPAGQSGSGITVNFNNATVLGGDWKRVAQDIMREIDNQVRHGGRTLYASGVTR